MAAAEPTDQLAPIELYTADSRIVAWVAADGMRVTDLLNERSELRLWRPTPGPIGEPGRKDGRVPDTSDGGEWQELQVDRVVLAMPPEWRASRQLRLHRKLRRVAMTAATFKVTGNVHLPPGAEPNAEHIFRRGRFVPLTEAYLLHNGEPAFEHVVSVVIVNTAFVEEVVPLVTLA